MGRVTPINAEFFHDDVTGLGSPGGAAATGAVSADHRLTTRRREFLTALVCLDTSLVVAVIRGRDRAGAVRLLTDHAPDAQVIACDLFWGFKSAVAATTDPRSSRPH